MAFGVSAPGRAKIDQRTLRTDRWWVPDLLTVVGLLAWITYATVRVFMQKWFWVDQYHYLTPFYSPCLSTGCPPDSAVFPQFLPDVWWLPYAALTLPFLFLFRFTCYYYRKAYYRSFWLSPPACAVAEPHGKYKGETEFPMIGQNFHRYFFYAAGVISLINTWDAVDAFHGADGGFGVGLGTVILWTNVLFLWAYTASCHSCRNTIGGRLNHFSRHPMRYKAWTWVSKLNSRHMQLAWTTLCTLVITDFYVMAVSAGWITDFRFYN
jgi:hypothetical protein